jgi:hypothetical protein
MSMRRDLMIYSLLLVLGLGGAYYFSLPDNTKESNQQLVEWIRLAPKSIDSISYTGKKVIVEATRLKGGEGFVIKSTNAEAAAESPDREEIFKANTKFNELVEKFNPLYVKRDLGAPKPEQLVEYGLSEPVAVFKVRTGKGDKDAFELNLGKGSYGNKSTFALDVKKGKAVLFDSQIFNDIENARKRLFEQRLFALAFDEVASVDIAAGGKDKSIETKRDNSGEVQWVDAAEKDKVNPSFKSWMNQIEKLRVVKYASAAEQSALPAESLLEVKLKKSRKEETLLKFKKSAPAAGSTEETYWVESSFLGIAAKVSADKVSALIKDLPTILGD